MNRMHRPDPKRPPNMQDKRSVVPIDFENVDTWLFGTQAEAEQLVRVQPLEVFDAAPVMVRPTKTAAASEPQ